MSGTPKVVSVQLVGVHLKEPVGGFWQLMPVAFLQHIFGF